MKKLIKILILVLCVTIIDVNAEEQQEKSEQNITPTIIEEETNKLQEENIQDKEKIEESEKEIFSSEKVLDSSIKMVEINGDKYCLDENGNRLTGFQQIDGKKYFFSKINEKLKYGWQGLDGNLWYQNELGEVVTGIQTIDGNKYYFNEEGYRQTGFQQIDGKRYFFSKITGALKYGWQGLDGNLWYQNELGEVVTGIQTIDGNKYYFNEEGYRQTGFQQIDGKRYFFSKITAALKYGWQGMNNEYWYQNETGALLTGLQNINGRDYNFDSTSGILLGFKHEGGKMYYYNPDGTQAKGIQYMINQFWKFNEITGAFEKNVREVRTIDVSSHQGNINWEAVKASNKVDAVILRLGYGSAYIDTKFIQNKKELERLGIPYSVYLFSYADNKEDSLRESNFLVNTLMNNSVNIASHIFSIYYDLEDWEIKSTIYNSYGISKDTYGEMITTFIENTEQKTCIKTRVYASKNYIETRFPQDKQQYATWVAQWNDTITYQGPYEGWQYTNCEYIPGINGCVDMSKFYY